MVIHSFSRCVFSNTFLHVDGVTQLHSDLPVTNVITTNHVEDTMQLCTDPSLEEKTILGIFQIKSLGKQKPSEESKLFCIRSTNTIYIYRDRTGTYLLKLVISKHFSYTVNITLYLF